MEIEIETESTKERVTVGQRQTEGKIEGAREVEIARARVGDIVDKERQRE